PDLGDQRLAGLRRPARGRAHRQRRLRHRADAHRHARGPRPRGDARPRLPEGPARHGRRRRPGPDPRHPRGHARHLPGAALPREPLAQAPRAARRLASHSGAFPMLDAYIYDGLRSPIGRHAGKLAPVRPDDLAGEVIREVVTRNKVDPAEISDVVLGCVNQAGEDNRNVARFAALLSGLPPSTPGVTVNRLCASGLQAVVDAARAVTVGEGDLYVAGGVESMSRAPYVI